MKISAMKYTRKDEKGSALIIVLAFLFLLTIVTIAFLSRSLLERQLSNASLNQNKIDLVAQSAAASIIGDLQQEIVAGSTISATGVYSPISPTDVVPSLAVPGETSSTIITGMEDLLKVSNHANGATGNRASAINTTSNASLNFRSISAARWNKALLLAKQSPTTTDRTPVTAFPTPDWIYVARDGSNPGNGGTAVSINNSSPYISLPSVDPSAAINNTQAGHNPITQRYAYALYDEGSTLDMNVAGSPITGTNGSTITYTPQQPYKNALAYADLTQLLTGFGLSASQEEAFVNGIVGWRNNGSGQASGSFPSYTFGVAVPPAAHPFDAFILSTRGGFLSSGGSATQSDNAFTSRQQLLQYLTTPTFLNAAGLTDAQMQTLCPYLGTFSRDISQPSYAPPSGRPTVLTATNGGNNAYGADDKVNPSFLDVTVPSNATFTRNDGSAPVAGEPLVKKRFALNRIAWVTYAGPSGEGRNLSDPDMQALINDGIPATFLQEGTKANIQKYFGLDWDSSNHQWKYDINNGGSGPIQKIAAMTTPHDPDFFELLKSAIAVGSVGKALGNSVSELPADSGSSTHEQPTNFNYYAESSVDYQILQIGANIIDQFQPANYAVQIVFSDGQSVNPRTIVGVENLPYLADIFNGVLPITHPTTLPKNSSGAAGTPGDSTYGPNDAIGTGGIGVWMQTPVIWNPHDPSSPVGAIGPTSFRILADSTTPDGVIGNNDPYYYLTTYAATGAGGSAGASFSYQTVPPTSMAFKNPTNGDGNADIRFSTPSFSPTKELCPEPVVAMRYATITDNNQNRLAFSLSNSSYLFGDASLNASAPQNSSLKSTYFSGAPGTRNPEPLDKYTTNSYVGFYLGSFPLAWKDSATGNPVSASQGGAVLARVSSGPGATTGPGNPSSCYMTYRMQYKDTQGNWVTYDTKYGKAYDGSVTALYVTVPSTNYGSLVGAGDVGFMTDPRTSRFGIMSNTPFDSALHNVTIVAQGPGAYNIGVSLPGPEAKHDAQDWGTEHKYVAGWLDATNAIIYTIRPENHSGFFSKTGWNSLINPSSGWMAYIGSNNSSTSGFIPGMTSQNNTDIYTDAQEYYQDQDGSGTQTPNYFADPDGMVRRGMGAFVALGTSQSASSWSADGIAAADTTVGLPLARVFDYSSSSLPLNGESAEDPSITNYDSTGTQVTSQAQSRPYFLHRPFNSVAELGYVFSDTPWRNLDFFTAESGDTALLDIFCINDTSDPSGLVAGKINLNTRQVPVLQAVLAGAYLDPVLESSQPDNTTTITECLDFTKAAPQVAKALIQRTQDTTNIPNGTGPLTNVSELVGKWRQKVPINDLSSLITGPQNGVLSSNNGFYDGKLSYAGFGGGVWDTKNHKPLVNGVEDFSSANGASINAGSAEDIYSAYVDSGSFTSPNKNHNGTLETVSSIQRFREAPIRALAAVGTTRVWNLMIDVIAQAGRFPSSATGLDQFNVEGERRYWVHVAIDRLTGKILDEQIEEVKE
jgi:Tfp pilus assembly protein PilX